MTGTCRTYRCLDCGEVWTWRTTAESMRVVRDLARTHRLMVVTC